jgi:ubiquinone/menaquinone biosynthesis C-methylase UbiE
MVDAEQIRSYVKAYEWGGPTSALQLHHLRELSSLIRPGDTVLDLACGPGPLLLELAPLYPECRFVGADLSRPMLDVLMEQADARKLTNVEVLCEDIRVLPTLTGRTVDMIISTSALHHLPDVESLQMVFQRIETLLAADGGIYMFDFGQLRSAKTRALLVAEVAKSAPAVTAKDYDLSLRAAFPIDEVLRLSRESLCRPFEVRSSSFVDFFYFLQTAARSNPSAPVRAYIAETLARCSIPIRLEHAMLRAMRVRR